MTVVPTAVAARLGLDLKPGQPLRGFVWDALDSLAMEHPATPWRTVRRMLLAHYLPYYSASEQGLRKRLLAWARRQWRQLSRTYTQIGLNQRLVRHPHGTRRPRYTGATRRSGANS
jgi:hypothetical protein